MNHRQGRALFFYITAALMLLSSSAGQAGNLDSSTGPADAASAMYSLQDFQNRLATGAAGAKRSGGFTEPVAGPGATGASLNDIMALMPAADNANGAKTTDVPAGKTFWSLNTLTGQWGLQTGANHVASYVCATGWAGANCDTCATFYYGPDCIPRFTDNNNGTVTDLKTGLIWLKNASPCGLINWFDAGAYCASLASGTAGLTDGSTAGQWRLPTKAELQGIGTDPPATWTDDDPSVTWTMPGSPFTGVQLNYYWSSTTYGYTTDVVWIVFMGTGSVIGGYKAGSIGYIWPVRSGQLIGTCYGMG